MLLEPWIWAALASMLLYVVKVMSVRIYCRDLDANALVFYSRAFPAIALVLPAYYSDFVITDPVRFWGAAVLATLLTIGASTLYIRALQQGMLAIVAPVQASIPVFMILTTLLLYREAPGPAESGLILVVTASVSASVYQVSRHAPAAYKSQVVPMLYSLSAALLYGISTVVDRVALQAVENGTFLYVLVWNTLTLLLIGSHQARAGKLLTPLTHRRLPVIVFMAAGLGAMILQQYAVELSERIPNAVTYVKTIVLMHIGIAALAGLVLLRERLSVVLLLSNLVTLGASVALVLTI
ncbi:MAG: EamA family transporter [Pseudomonadota bacterium]